MQTLQDVIDLKIKLLLSHHNEHVINLSNNLELQNLLTTANVNYQEFETDFDCLRILLESEDEIACIISSNPVLFVKNYFSYKEKGWILHVVDEPLYFLLEQVGFLQSSPYIDRINVIYKRMFDAGLFSILYPVNYWDYIVNDSPPYLLNLTDISNEIQSNSFLMFFLMITYLLSILIFISEIVFQRIVSNIDIGRYTRLC